MGLFDRFKKGKKDDAADEVDEHDDDLDEGDDEEEVGDLFQQISLTTAALTTDSWLVTGEGKEPQVMPSFTAELLARCTEFESLEDHAGNLCRVLRLAPGQEVAVTEQLEQLIEDGWLVEHDDIVSAISDAAPADEAGTFSTLGVVTADRPAELERCVQSFLDAIGDREIDLVVVDDSKDDGNREANRAALARLAADSGKAIRHAGPAERAAFASAVAEELGGDREIVELALLGGHGVANVTGGARNALLLRAAGERIFTADDDVICRTAPVPDSRHGLAFSSASDPTRIVPYADVDAAVAAVDLEAIDLLAEHERLIGRRAARLVADADPDDLDLTGATARFLARTARGLGRVRISCTGAAGDSGMGSPSYYLHLSGHAAEAILADNETYREAVEGRALVRGVPTTTISNRFPFLMGMAIGFDQTAPLPPFFPVLRNSDGVLGRLLAVVEPAMSVGHVPRVIEHRPPGDRRFDSDDTWKLLGRARAGDLVGDLVEQTALDIDHGDAAARMAVVGRQLAWLGSLSPAELLETTRRVKWGQAGVQLALFEHRLNNEDGLPPLVTEHLEKAIEQLVARVEEPDFGAPVDLLDGRSVDEAMAIFGKLLAGYGRMLEIWPDVWAAAKAVRARGVDLGVTV